jgi:hypothetical protein
MPESANPRIFRSVALWWRETRSSKGRFVALRQLAGLAWEFFRDSLPSRRRQRYGDIDYDWDHRVDTTAATVNWRDRLLGLLNSPYQPTDPALFHEMLASLKIDFCDFVFIDIGSGKCRTLLMASHYPFRRIIGVELLPELHRVAQENIARYKNDSKQCLALESICADACDFVFPLEPTVLYLFNPLPEPGLVILLANLEQSLRENPRLMFVLYHNPVLEHVLAENASLTKLLGTRQYSLYATISPRGLPRQ